MSPKEQLVFWQKIRMGSFGTAAIFGGLQLTQVLPLLYAYLHQEDDKSKEITTDSVKIEEIENDKE